MRNTPTAAAQIHQFVYQTSDVVVVVVVTSVVGACDCANARALHDKEVIPVTTGATHFLI
jgi:hypothetical protein